MKQAGEPLVVPEAAQKVFGVSISQAQSFADFLASAGTERGLIGPREVPRLWDRHLLNCAVITEVMPENATVADIGSGAGLPGILVALRRPDLSVTLIEPLLRRTTFLTEAVALLDLQNVQVIRGRAEEVDEVFDVVTSRAVAPLGRLLGWSMPLVRSGGQLLAMKGASAEEEIASAGSLIKKFGRPPAEVVEVGGDVLSSPVRLVRLVKK